jgi:hypothetical protein
MLILTEGGKIALTRVNMLIMNYFSHLHNNNEFGPSFSDHIVSSPFFTPITVFSRLTSVSDGRAVLSPSSARGRTAAVAQVYGTRGFWSRRCHARLSNSTVCDAANWGCIKVLNLRVIL